MDFERYGLSTGRISEITEEGLLKEPYLSYFRKASRFALRLASVYELKKAGKLCKPDIEMQRALNTELFEDVTGDNYRESYANPDFVRNTAKNNGCDYKLWQELCYLYSQLRGLIPYAYEGNVSYLVLYFELFIEIYGILVRSGDVDEKTEHEVYSAIYWFERDNLDFFVREGVLDRLDPERDFALRLIMDSDLSDLSYLYRFGEYISENEIRSAQLLNTLSEEEIRSMARTWCEAYRTGFIKAGKPIERKTSVNIRYRLGFERIVREAVRQFEEMGLKTVIYRSPTLAGDMGVHLRDGIGYSGACASRQYEYDHREDKALFFDREYVKRRLDILRNAYEDNKALANGHAGPAVMETFGEAPFTPEASEGAIRFTAAGQKLLVSYTDQAGRLANEYIIGEERSFTIISYPVCEIGPDYEEIFKETVRLNTLDYKLYETIQQRLIDVLDTAERVQVLGCSGNETDLTISLVKLGEPSKETIFENCVADVNIPVGEVFTTPVLKDTCGLLHVKEVFLNGLKYKELKLNISDGMIREYSCENFSDAPDNSRFIKENLLFHHESLPMGEFAIGTNTLAYRMARDHGIGERLPILIGEKTGPHFAFGDTCYAREEDVAVYNPDGKEIVARSNEISDRRKTDPDKAYFFCHTDITIPYDELKGIYAVRPDGERIPIIENGLFVLEGTEALNEALLSR
ncbi:MAG TPA: leucyl aminopeptidase [Lachnospiraceae bacterium]|nr:leucyl aminopeptidase [Lachnospiraceae bacterium]